MGFTDEEHALFAEIRSTLGKSAGHRESPLQKALQAYDLLNKCFKLLEKIEHDQRVQLACISVIKENDAAHLRSMANRGQLAN